MGDKRKGGDSEGYSQGEKGSCQLKQRGSRLGHLETERQKTAEKQAGNRAHSKKFNWKAELRTADRCPVLPPEQLAGDRVLPHALDHRVWATRSWVLSQVDV